MTMYAFGGGGSKPNIGSSDASSNNEVHSSGSENENYPYPSHVNAESFLSVKLSGSSNYVPWRAQMLCLLDSHDMIGFIDGTLKEPELKGSKRTAKYREWKRSDTLVKGWIYGSLSEGLVSSSVNSDYQTAKEVWNWLHDVYTSKSSATKESDVIIALRKAIETGNWDKVQELFNKDKHALTEKIDKDKNTALSLAIRIHANDEFLENLIDLIDLESHTTLVPSLGFAIEVGNIAVVKKLVNKNPNLLFMTDHYYHGFVPLVLACFYSQKTIYYYLYEKCQQYIGLAQKDGLINPFKGQSAYDLFYHTIVGGYFDVAYDLLKEYYDELSTVHVVDYPGGDLNCLVQQKDLYRSAKQYNFYQSFIYSHLHVEHFIDTGKIPEIENQGTYRANSCTWKSYYVYPVIERIYVKFWKIALQHVPHIKHLHEDKVTHIKTRAILKFICEKIRRSENPEQYTEQLILAVENDIPEIIEEITRSIPQSIRIKKDDKYTLYQLSIMNRCEKAYNFFVYKETYHKDLHHQYGHTSKENLLHLVGKLAPQDKINMVTGAALQMQRELQWFQEVRKLVPNHRWEARNDENKTPMMVFRKEHDKLRQKGEDWMKKTTDAYTITATLIMTIVFAAAITIPGGNNQDTGKPIYKSKSSFIIFMVSDAISLFTSTTSLLLFLSILTSRYAEDDFLYKLPKRLILGLVMLFMSVTTMLVAFGATLYIMSGQENSWILIPIATITCLPVASFVTLQLPLLVDLISSTYGRGIFGK